LKEILALAAVGKLRCQTVERPLSQVNEVLDQLRQGEVTGRIVLRPS
jgi:D-arabinose 1-dehydrogenase-like Zn-dependent alcohol dehydrogenase